ncbi:MAG: hypothetical protein AAFV28_11560 [Cyanobacteria bacterium J06635_13]
MSNLFLSLFLAALMSFSLPVFLFGTVLGFLTLTSYVPGFLEASDRGSAYILNFLAVFGAGKPMQGIITLGITVSIVGILLDISNFYRYQSLRDEDFS